MNQMTPEAVQIINLAAGATATCIDRDTVNELGLLSTICRGLEQVRTMNLAFEVNERVEGIVGNGTHYLAETVAQCFAKRWSIPEKPGLLASFKDMSSLFKQALVAIKTAEEDQACAERLKLALAVLAETGFGGDAETQVAPTEATESTTPPAQPAAAPIAAAAPKPVTTVTSLPLSHYKETLNRLMMNTVAKNLRSPTKGGKGMINPWATEAACRWGIELIHDPNKRLRRTTPFTAAEAAELEKVLISLLEEVMEDREIDAFFDRKGAELGLPKRPQRHSVIASITPNPSSPKPTQEQIRAQLNGQGAGQQVAPPRIRSKQQQRKDAAAARRLSAASGKPSKKELKRAKKAAQELEQNAARDANPAAAETIKLAPPLETALNIDELDDAALEAATAPQAEPGFDLPLYQLLGPAQLQSDAQNAA